MGPNLDASLKMQKIPNVWEILVQSWFLSKILESSIHTYCVILGKS